MKGNSFVTVASVVIAAASISYAAGRSVQAVSNTSQPVLVTNTTSQPMPVSLYHSIAVPVTESGSWAVRPANTAATPVFAKDVDNEVRHIFTRTYTLQMQDSVIDIIQDIAVPVGSTLLVKGVSGNSDGETQGDYASSFFMYDVHSGSQISYWSTNLVQLNSNAFFSSIPNPNVYFTVPGGDSLRLDAERAAAKSGGISSTQVTVTGELISNT